MGVDYVIDTTGLFTSKEKAGRHIDAGAKKVIISNNASGGGIKSIIMGVNDTEYDPQSHHIVSCATCTANCIIPLIDSLMRAKIGIEKGHITIILPYTASRKVVDTYSTKGWRDGRSAAVNIIPSTVHASKSIADIFPALNGKITDTVFRVPVPEVAMVEFSLITENDTSIHEIDGIFKQAAENQLRGYLAISNDEIVSSDCIDNDHSSIYDSLLTLNSNPYNESHFFRIFSWFDNEWGYANRLVDLLKKISV
jgi:glyceraldehyde 3-phosphate dehydrogenase